MFRFTSILDLVFTDPVFRNTVTIPLSATNGFVRIDSSATRDLGSVDECAQLMLSVVAGDFAAFVGPGTFDLNCASMVNNTTGGGGGNVAVAQVTQAGCGAAIIYTFDAASAVQPLPPTTVAEPGSMALAGLGLFGLAALGRRR